ncbi:MAG: hypothetical protein IKO07_08235 [Clostridia bacterium]|nr:hypothetical protein [Clostridia bacterium]
MTQNKAPCGDVARVRVAPPGRAERVAAYRAETGDPGCLFGGPLEVQARYSPHASPLRLLEERRDAAL